MNVEDLLGLDCDGLLEKLDSNLDIRDKIELLLPLVILGLIKLMKL